MLRKFPTNSTASLFYLYDATLPSVLCNPFVGPSLPVSVTLNFPFLPFSITKLFDGNHCRIRRLCQIEERELLPSFHSFQQPTPCLIVVIVHCLIERFNTSCVHIP